MSTAPQCNVFPSGVLGYVVQIALAITSLLSLVIKYKLTGAGRTHGQFLVDTSKQAAGAFWIHLVNMKCAEILAGTRIGHDISDECSWYLMQNIVDTAVGPVVAFAIFHQVLTSLRKAGYEPLVKEIVASERAPRDSEPLSEPLIGQRRNSAGVPQTITFSIVIRQVLTWLAVVTCMKFVMLAFLLVFSDTDWHRAESFRSASWSQVTTRHDYCAILHGPFAVLAFRQHLPGCVSTRAAAGQHSAPATASCLPDRNYLPQCAILGSRR